MFPTVKQATHTLEYSVAEKYLGNKIHEDGTAASITYTINSKLSIAKAKSEEILKICNDPLIIASGWDYDGEPGKQVPTKSSSSTEIFCRSPAF